PAHVRPNFLDHSRQFVPEQRRRNDHARVIAALIHLEVSTAGERHLHFDKHFAIAHSGDGNLFDFYVLFSVEDRCRHLSVHLACPSHALPGCMTTFNESGFGWAATRNASTLCCKGKRCVMSRSKSISRLKTNWTDSSCRSTEAL